MRLTVKVAGTKPDAVTVIVIWSEPFGGVSSLKLARVSPGRMLRPAVRSMAPQATESGS